MLYDRHYIECTTDAKRLRVAIFVYVTEQNETSKTIRLVTKN